VGDGCWSDGGALVLRRDGVQQRAEGVPAAATQVLLLRTWLEAGIDPGPPPPVEPPVLPTPDRSPGSLHAPHLLPGAGARSGLELAAGGVGSWNLGTVPLELAAEGYLPALDLAAGLGSVRVNAAVWNLWEPNRARRPVLLGGLGVLVVDRERVRVAPWLGLAGGWGTEEPASTVAQPMMSAAASSSGFAGYLGAGVSLEVSAERLCWDLSLPLAGVGLWREDTGSGQDETQGRVVPLFTFPEAGISWMLSPADRLRFGLLAYVPSLGWRHDWGHAFVEGSLATTLGTGELGDGEALLAGAVQLRAGFSL